jgi:hypothetical protein
MLHVTNLPTEFGDIPHIEGEHFLFTGAYYVKNIVLFVKLMHDACPI